MYAPFTCTSYFSRGQGELLSEEAITTIHSKLRRSKEERVAASKVLIFYLSHMHPFQLWNVLTYRVCVCGSGNKPQSKLEDS